MESLNPKLEIQNITKIYQKKVLDQVSFNVEEGELLSILGPSGCGKSTLLRIIIGLLEPTGGKIIKEGADITLSLPSERGMGIVFQNFALFDNMSVLENVSYALRKQKHTKKTAIEQAEKLINKVGLIEYKNKKPRFLSGGQQQRVAIARTLAMNPEIILFDEPMSSLDVATRLSLRKEIKDIQKEFGTTMIYITHDQEEAFALSDRILVMREAGVVQIDTPENIIKNPANEYVQTFVINNLQLKMDSLIKYMKVL